MKEGLRQKNDQPPDIFDGLAHVLREIFPPLQKTIDLEQVLRENCGDLTQIEDVLVNYFDFPKEIISNLPLDEFLRLAEKIINGLNPKREIRKLIKHLPTVSLPPQTHKSSFPFNSTDKVGSLNKSPSQHRPPWSRVNDKLAKKQPPGDFSQHGSPYRGHGRYSSRK